MSKSAALSAEIWISSIKMINQVQRLPHSEQLSREMYNPTEIMALVAARVRICRIMAHFRVCRQRIEIKKNNNIDFVLDNGH